MSKNIKQIFSVWGKAKRAVPERNEAMKSEIIGRSDRWSELSGRTAKARFPWFSVAFAGLAVIALFIQPAIQTEMGTKKALRFEDSAGTAVESDGPSENLGKTLVYQDIDRSMPYYRDGLLPITDNREFLKINYNADIRTRKVNDLGNKIQTIVRGHGGRIDSLNISKKYATIRFALPEDKFDAFRGEINGLVRTKFITENISAHNLLPQIQSSERSNKDNTLLLNDIATVQGGISVRWISVWEIITLYAGPYWMAIALALIAAASYIFRRYFFS